MLTLLLIAKSIKNILTQLGRDPQNQQLVTNQSLKTRLKDLKGLGKKNTTKI